MRNLIQNGFPKDSVTAAAPAALLALLATSLAWNQHGSLAPGDWLFYAALTALLAGAVLVTGSAAQPGRATVVAMCALLALAAWDAISIGWSPMPSLARNEALLVAFYGIALTVPIVALRSESDRRLAASLSVGALGLLAVGTLVAVRFAHDPGADYEGGRLTFPISYVNAQGAIETLGFWPAVAFAADPRGRLLLRGFALAAATAFLAGWLLTQSKGAGLSLLGGALFLLAVSPSRLRVLIPTAIAATLVFAAYAPLTQPFRHQGEPGFADAIRSATTTAIVLSVLALGLGLAYAALDRRVSIGARVRRASGVGLIALVAATLVGSTVVFFIKVDHPGRFFHDRWTSFKTLPTHEGGSSHLVNIGSNRYDFWRVDLTLFAHHPLGGVGARGFAPDYLRLRRSNETPARGHSLVLDTLAETGVVGAVLLMLTLCGALTAAIGPSRGSLTAAGCAAAGAAWIAHTTVDWVWTIPATGVAAFLFLGIAASRAGPRTIPSRFAVPLGFVSLLLAVGVFVPPWLSARLTHSALTNRASAASDLRWAKRLDPLAIEPYVAESFLARAPEAAIAPLRKALAKQPQDAALHFQLSRAYSASGRQEQARAELIAAQRLDPRDRRIRTVLGQRP